LFGLITGEQLGGTWVRTTGTGGTFNAAAGTYTPALNATTSTFKYLLSATAPCIPDESIATVNINPLPTVSVNSGARCISGTNSAAVLLTATHNAANPSFLWNTGETEASISVSPNTTTTYTVTVTNGTTTCSNSASGTVTVNPLPAISCPVPDSAPVACGVTQGIAQALADADFAVWFAQGPVAPANHTVVATYAYSAGAAPNPEGTAPLILAFTNPAIVSTSVTVTWTITNNITGCVNSCNSTWTLEYGCALSCNSVPTNLTCNGNNTGSITGTVQGGTPPYTAYLVLSTAPTVQVASPIPNIAEGGSYTFSGLAANAPGANYIVISADATTTILTGSPCPATITEPTAVSCTIVSDNPDCFGDSDGSLTATGSGGTGAYEYSLNGGTFQASGTFTGLVANVLYTVTTRDANGCTSTCTETLTQPTAVSCSIVSDNPLCFGGTDGSLTASASGGTGAYEYSLNGGAFQVSGTFTGLVANILYTVTTRDINLCTSTCTVTLTQPTAVGCTIQPTNPDCFGGTDGSLTATGSGGTGAYSYSLNGGAFQASGTFTGLVANVLYTITTRDANGCTSTCPATLTDPTAVSCTIQPTNPDCFGANTGSLAASGSGGTGAYEYSLNGGAFQASGTFTGLVANVLYTVTTRDANGCTSTCPATLTQPTAVSCTIQSTNPDCSGANTGSLTASGSGGTGAYSYSLNGGAFQASGTFSGLVANVLYTVTTRDANGCTTTCTATLIAPICGYGCTPGYWQGGSGKQTWDQTSDPIAALAGFTTTSSFYTVFGITPGTCGLPARLTMIDAITLGGGKCNKLVRHGTAGLLNAITLSGYPLPTGIANVAALKLAIKNAINSCNCEPLASQIAANNELNHDLCGTITTATTQRLILNAELQISGAKTVESAGFEVYPVPFKDLLTIRYKFDYVSDVTIEVFDSSGGLVLSKTDTEGGLNKEVALNINSNTSGKQVYIVKLTTNRGSTVKKVMSSN